jgi:hypothetical protein
MVSTGGGTSGRITPGGQRKVSRGKWDLAPFLHFSWQAHIGGLAGGVAAGWIFRERRPKATAKPGLLSGTTGPAFPGGQTGVIRGPGDPGTAP